MPTRTVQLIIAFGAIASMAVALSALFAGYGSIGDNSAAEATTAPVNETSSENDYDSYLEPCYTCTPTEDDYENLTTFELLAKFPQLSGDPIANVTGDFGMDDEPEPESNTETNVNVTESAQISDNSTEASGNATGSEPLPEADNSTAQANSTVS